MDFKKAIMSTINELSGFVNGLKQNLKIIKNLFELD